MKLNVGILDIVARDMILYISNPIVNQINIEQNIATDSNLKFGLHRVNFNCYTNGETPF